MVIVASGNREWTRELSETLSQAFRDDPAICWVLKGDPESRQKSLLKMFPAVVAASSRSGLVRATEDGAAVSLWRNPDALQPGLIETMSALPVLLGIFGLRLPRALRLNAYMYSKHPDVGAFYYLQYVGVRPRYQGKGLGRQVIGAGLSIADSEERPVVLETANPDNVPLYQRMGFDVVEEWQVAAGAPKFWTMLRTAP